MNPNVAIILTNYNYGEYVIDAIKSIEKQTYRGKIKIFLVNDGSTDDSWQRITDYAASKDHCDIKVERSVNEAFDKPYYKGRYECVTDNDTFKFININNSGASVARNVAMWEAWNWTDIFGVLDADDEYKENKVEVLVEALKQYEEIGVAYADYDVIKTYNQNNYTKYELKQSYSKEKLHNSCIVHSGSLFKKEFAEKIILENYEFFDSRLHGPASKGFIGCTEDYDFWLRMSNHCIMVHIPESLSLVKESGKNQSMKMTSQIFNENAKIMGTRIK